MNHFVPHAARTPRLRFLTGALLLVWMGSAASTAWAQQIESITLSSAGMAEIERQIPVSDTGTAQLRVPLTQVDDILKNPDGRRWQEPHRLPDLVGSGPTERKL